MMKHFSGSMFSLRQWLSFRCTSGMRDLSVREKCANHMDRLPLLGRQ